MLVPNSFRYRQQDGLRYHLEQRFSNKREEFPQDNTDYITVFHQIEQYLNLHVHPEVNIGATIRGNGLLNDHGKEHVAMVIARTQLLLEERIESLTGYEVFLLLIAIHFHDVGNIGGREEHELRIYEVMTELGTKLPLDNPTQKYIAKIAMAHGGKINESRDTISVLPIVDHLQGKRIRPSLLAAILRYADEISDDHTRAARFLFNSGQVPDENKIFHTYSSCLQPAAISGSALILKFDVPYKFATEQLPKDNQQVFLYDEILERLKKCMRELKYCSRYCREFLQLTTIQADITVNKAGALNAIYEDSIRFRTAGYPDTSTDIQHLVEKPPKAKNGHQLKNSIEEG